MLTGYDYLNVGFYFVFIVGVGAYFSRLNRNTSDYFRGGGALPWWITGASAWMAGFSAWSFTGAAGKIYETGPYVLVLYYQSVLPILILYFFTCYRFRRLRVVTPMEALRLRFGPATQQFYTWLRLPIQLLFGAFALNAVSIFVSALFGFEVWLVVIVLGALVTGLSLFGGAQGIAAGDFVQMFLIVLVALSTVVLALAHPAVGGLAGLLERAPAAHFAWQGIARAEFISLWFAGLTLNTLFAFNSLSDEKAAKYMMAESDSHARRMLVIPLVGTLFGSLLWIIPPMAAAIVHPQIGAEFPMLRFPNEAAFLAIARDVLPQGMLGLLICCIFAASLTDLGGILNWGAGLLLRNFYLPVLNPACPEVRLVWLSRLGALLLGVVLVAFALLLSRYRTLGLFDLLNQFGTSLLMPLAIPAFLGMYFARTPPWSAWSTAVLGLVMAGVAKFWVTPEMLAWVPGLGAPFLPEERTVFGIIATALLVAPTCIAWFFLTAFFYRRSPAAHQERVTEFFARMRTPLPDAAGAAAENRPVPWAIGRMCLLYGGFILLLALIPNPLSGRLCYLVCGGVLLALGVAISVRYRGANTPAAGTAGT